MSTTTEDLARNEAIRLFERCGKRNVRFDNYRAKQKRKALPGALDAVWPTAKVALWFLTQARGVASESEALLKPGWAVASDASLCQIPFRGSTAKFVGRFPDTFSGTPAHPKSAFYRMYDLNTVPVGEMVVRMTSDWVVWIFIRTSENWEVFVFALDLRVQKKRKKKRNVPSSTRRSAPTQVTGSQAGGLRPFFSDTQYNP